MFIVAALYHFTRFKDHRKLCGPLQNKCDSSGVTGSLLVAPEGINGTISGSRQGIDNVIEYIKALPGCSNIEHKESVASLPPFPRMKVKIKKEIVTMGQPDVNPEEKVGKYVEPKDWDAFINASNVVLIDTRNDYEVGIGTFKGAVNPKTKSFSEFPEWWEENKENFQNKKIAMFCTGGIRCEKSTNYLLGKGVKEVHHLKGGILKYLEEIPEEQSSWEGDCFVFDARVSVRHGLTEGPHHLCYACRHPILPKDQSHCKYEHGVSCHQCFDKTSDYDKSRFRERQKQIKLARDRGEKHMVGYDGN